MSASLRAKIACTAVAVPLAGLALLLGSPFLLVRLTDNKVARYTPHIKPSGADKWSPAFWLGNADDSIPPPDYLPDDRDRVTKWYFRNPLHNFTFYVIGIADKEFERIGLCPETNFNPNDGWNWTVCKYGWPGLPFISYKQGKLECYFGWRDGGNFGIKLNF